MKAAIESETGNQLVVSVLDNADEHHRITLDRTGTLHSHSCGDEARKAAALSGEQAIRARRSVRFAKYYCYRTHEIAAIDAYGADQITYPERLAATALVLAALTPETIERLFETVSNRFEEPADHVVEPPAVDPDAQWTRIEQDLLLDGARERLPTLADATIELEAIGALRQLLDRYPDRRSDRLPRRLATILGSNHSEDINHDRTTAPGWSIVDTGTPHVHWEGGEVTPGPDTDGADDTGVANDTDWIHGARIQLPCPERPVRTPAGLQRHLLDHLRCQLRDCYVGMGLAPPSDCRVRGPGIARCTELYETHPTEQRYHDPDAVIDWTQFAPVPQL
ncbi:hypothetical protein Halru_2693 [Halovivax ruber XH-70]|uniref:Uncharacterized protein n=1 Tax=Halovivax ruber (strain DSM 18193 / JCM 13892 / XH-70) TaxID=797302 RepID=L0IEK7_HALRX|nr:hypothetical protein [Halovivax ruber]AGB17268.1 hypothetical protein Halru_2693 [Halovivax ruber XH-70]